MTDDITEAGLIALEHRRGDGRKMYSDTATYRLTTLDENPDAENQRRPGTLRGIAADFIRARGGEVLGRELHHHMLTAVSAGKWDYGYVHMVSDKNLMKRGASRDWLRVVGNPVTESYGAEVVANSDTSYGLADWLARPDVHCHRVTLQTELIERRENLHRDAYRSAWNSGARFVAVLNHEAVWLWDRRRGRTYAEQKIGRFATGDSRGIVSAFEGAPVTQDLLLSFDDQPVSDLDEYSRRLSDVARGIRLLRADRAHVERAHERIVDHFLMALGFDPYSEIGFRQGRIDMTVYLDQRPALAFEVKRDWSLQQAAFEQAYDYSSEHGMRYFVVTNGDDYHVHDCWKSLRRGSNEVAHFRLSALRSGDERVLSWMERRGFNDRVSDVLVR